MKRGLEGSYVPNIHSLFIKVFDAIVSSGAITVDAKCLFDHITVDESYNAITQRVFAKHEEQVILQRQKGLSSFIDHTFLRADATKSDIDTLCSEALTHSFACVCVNGCRVEQAVDTLKTKLLVAAVVGFPLGAATTKSKVEETKELCSFGATEIDMVINIGHIKDKNWHCVLDDIRAVVQEAAKSKAIVKVILECSLLTTEEIVAACIVSCIAKAHYVKTSTVLMVPN